MRRSSANFMAWLTCESHSKRSAGAKRKQGSHFKPEFPDRNDNEWLKTTIARYDSATHSPVLSYEEVDTSLIAPRKRDYTKAH